MNQELQNAKELLQSHIDDTQDLSPSELAQQLKTIKRHDEDEYTQFLEKIDTDELGEIAIEMPDHMLKDVIENLPSEKIAQAIEELESDDQIDLLHYITDLDRQKAQEVFDKLDEEEKEDILKLAPYSDDLAGGYMQTEVFCANLNDDLRSAVMNLRRLKKEKELENIYQLFVVDDKNVLKYAIPLDELLMFDFEEKIKSIVENDKEEIYKPHFVYDTDLVEKAVEIVQDFDLSVIAVIDENGVLLGRITTDDIHDIIEETATEQIYNLAGVDDEAEEEDNTIKTAAKARALWLFINLGTALLSSVIIGIFDKTIEAIVALAVLMPIVSAMGGNAGTQALTVTVRRLALGEIEFKDAKFVLKREIGIALINGLIFSILLGFIAFFWFKISLLGVVICAAMVINMFIAGFFGAIIPITLKKFNIDPAVGSSVLLTAITDIVGFFSFLGLATWILL